MKDSDLTEAAAYAARTNRFLVVIIDRDPSIGEMQSAGYLIRRGVVVKARLNGETSVIGKGWPNARQILEAEIEGIAFHEYSPE